MFKFIRAFHQDETGDQAVQTVAILGVAILLLVIFKTFGGEALDTIKSKTNELIGGGK